ncbi:endonuclease/exonuclease/phosphatase family protein [Sphingobacterium sp. UBA5980]|uniref:endonuclease/exonuclease/phosphatase family protein n=1 Tax=Sphingobacterium sp. UBA5980 TaxID=1947504 RepID=UPI00257C2A53|nr:endonuclease/exonuclease/phosphatase family protein [Sphingobacterium sp. UBA5980]
MMITLSKARHLNLRPLLFVLITALLLSVNANGVSAQKLNRKVEIKTMTYNIYSARKMGIEAIASVIKKVDPDVVSLQEVERNTAINPMDFPKEIAALTGMQYYYFAHALTLKKGDYGNVILSKYPLLETKSIHLGVANDGDDIRSFGYALLEKEGKQFYFATTHLGYKKDDATRLKQIDEILAEIKNLKKPIILGADLNSRPNSQTMPALQKWFSLPCQTPNCEWTVPTPKPTYTCDWLIYAPQQAFEVKDYAVQFWADKESDHFPVVGTFNIK